VGSEGGESTCKGWGVELNCLIEVLDEGCLAFVYTFGTNAFCWLWNDTGWWAWQRSMRGL
jgi:hypothetical protein